MSDVAHGPVVFDEAEKCYCLLIKALFRTSSTYTNISEMTLASNFYKNVSMTGEMLSGAFNHGVMIFALINDKLYI